MNYDTNRKQLGKIENPVREHREIKESIVNDLKEHNNVISKIYFDLTDKITNSVLSIIDCYKNGGKVILIGNGGSASQSEHISAEFIGILKLPAIALTANTPIITALANDFGYERIFSIQLESIANESDILIVLSTSGNSLNILEAINTAKSKNIKTIAFTGQTGGKIKKLLSKKDILINVPSENTQRIQECHILIGHIIFGQVGIITKDLKK